MFLWLSTHPLLAALLVLALPAAALTLGTVSAAALDKLPSRWPAVGAAQIVVLLAGLGLAVLSMMWVGLGMSQANTDTVRDAVLAKYGTQITETGDVTLGEAVTTSSWVINGRRTPCTLDGTDRDDPVVTCGDELPLPNQH